MEPQNARDDRTFELYQITVWEGEALGVDDSTPDEQNSSGCAEFHVRWPASSTVLLKD